MTSNPVSSRQEDQEGPREGITIGETSRSLHECAVEHRKDAEAYSAKSHIIKHWMLAHPENNTPPQMAFKITSLFRDCLYLQIGKALQINYSRDRILNSKNEYMSNCISRLTIDEDAWERRHRCRQEEKAEKVAVAEVEAVMKSKQNIQLEPKDGMRQTPHQSSQEEGGLGEAFFPSSHEEEWWWDYQP